MKGNQASERELLRWISHAIPAKSFLHPTTESIEVNQNNSYILWLKSLLTDIISRKWRVELPSEDFLGRNADRKYHKVRPVGNNGIYLLLLLLLNEWKVFST